MKKVSYSTTATGQDIKFWETFIELMKNLLDVSKLFISQKIMLEHINTSHYSNGVPAMFTSDFQLKGKHCQKPYCRNGDVDKFGLYLFIGPWIKSNTQAKLTKNNDKTVCWR